MPDHKQLCKACKVRHLPPTGKKCQFKKSQPLSDNELLRDAAAAGHSSATQPQGSQEGGQQLQLEILQQLKKVTERLDKVEHRMETTTDRSTPTSKLSSDSFLQSIKSSKKHKKARVFTDSSSSDESDSPSLQMLRSSSLQKSVDKRLKDLEQSSQATGKDTPKFKSQRGGNFDIQVKHKVNWPHEAILGGATRQRMNYDQLSLTQWVQGFCRNVLEENDRGRRDIMISYLSDLMEDATDFSWQGAKAAHAVLLCEMERGSLHWEDSDRIDRIRRAHAQKHVQSKQNWGKNETKKPWFCKNFQTNNCTFPRDHETNGKLHRHICAFCLTNGKHLNHSEKNCTNKNQTKNEHTAVHH